MFQPKLLLRLIYFSNNFLLDLSLPSFQVHHLCTHVLMSVFFVPYPGHPQPTSVSISLFCLSLLSSSPKNHNCVVLAVIPAVCPGVSLSNQVLQLLPSANSNLDLH